MCSLLMCNSFRNILSKWISNFILPQLHHLYFLLYELSPTARMSEFFYWLVNLMCFATILLIMKLYVCQVSYSYIIPDLFYYLHSSCLLESLNSWLLPLGYPDFGAVWWFNSLFLSRLQEHEIKEFGYLSRCICRWFKRRPKLENPQ